MLIIKENQNLLMDLLNNKQVKITQPTLIEKLTTQANNFYSVVKRHLTTLKINHSLQALYYNDVCIIYYLTVDTPSGVVYFDLYGQHLNLNSILNRYGLNTSNPSTYKLKKVKVTPSSNQIEDLLFMEEALFHYLSD